MSDESNSPRLNHPRMLSDMLLYRLNRIRAEAGGVVLRLCEGKFGVTRREWVLLALLSRGPVSSSELAAMASLEKSATSKAVVTLVGKKLVARAPRLNDKRYAQLELTNSGRALFEQMMPTMIQINGSLLSELSAQETLLLDQLLDRIQAAAENLADHATHIWPAANRRGGALRRPAPR